MTSVLRMLRSSAFWIAFLITAAVTGVFFAWELGVFLHILPTFPRPPALPWEIGFTGAIALLLSINAGMLNWQRLYGKCPRGIKRMSGFAGFIGALTLICPACILLPAGLIGIGFFFVFLGPYLPYLRVLSIALLLGAMWLLRPKK